jgi:GNAT superfamily N-acetyltransferase
MRASVIDDGLFIEPMQDCKELASFVCGNQQMDDFIHAYLGECDACHYCLTYVVRSSKTRQMVAIFSLAFDSVKLDEDDFEDMRIGAAGTGKPSVEDWFRDRFEEKAVYPSLEIAYLAVAKDCQHLHLGTEILSQIEYMAKTQKIAGCVFLTVNALHTRDYSTIAFYEMNGFAKLTALPQADVWPMYKTLWVEDSVSTEPQI